MDLLVEEDLRILSKFHSISSTLSELLENTFIPCHPLEVDRGAGCPPTPPPTKLKRRLLMYKTIKLPGIPKEEFKNDPVILVALNRIVNLLKEYVVSSQQQSIDLSFSSSKQSLVELDRGLLEIGQLSTYTWEQLNVGHWKNVSRFWRKLYTCLQILKVPFMILKEHPIPEILRECDMGLLMGEPIGDNVLSQIAEELCAKIIMDELPPPATSPSKTILHQPEETLLSNYPPPLKNSSKNQHPVHIMDNPSLSEFTRLMHGSGTPCLLQNTINHWPALHKWNVDFLSKFFGFRSVPVEIGQKYTSEDWTQKIMTINEFIQKYMTVKKAPSPQGRTEGDEADTIIAYIAQHTLFDQLPKLGEDIKIPDYCTLGIEGLSSLEINGWLGPAGTVSPCHYDPKHNILVQVFGSKAIRLFPPNCKDKLRPHKEGSLLFNTSQLDVEDDKLFEKVPEMQDVDCIDLILRKGEALYMPPKWWHYVRSLEPSFSVSFWFN